MAEQRYTIHEQLGAGGNGAVYRAFDSGLRRWVAIKRLLSAEEAASNDPNAEELRREADTLASLRNANIVTIFDVATDSEGVFMVMELLEGPDLSDAISHGPLMLEDFKQLAEQSLEALLAAHNLRILHRDIKPENIKVERLAGGRLQAKIIDFGLARTGVAARKQTEDHEGSVMGSIYYMAPEQLSREPTDVRTDLYALGCVFYETLSGRKPFDGKTVNEVIDKHIDHDVVPLHQFCPHLPQWLTYWVMRLMACKPSDRPATAQQAIEEFRAWEKLPPMPGMMPWMPQGYGYPAPMPMYAAPGQHYTGQVPVQTGSYYPPHITSSSVPVQPQPQSGSVPVAVPVAMAPQPQSGSVPVPLAQAVRATGPQRTQSPPPPKPAGGGKKWLIIAATAAAAIVGGYVVLKGGKSGGGSSNNAGAKVAASFDPGPVREDLYPSDRNYPAPEGLRVVHFIARAATRPYAKGSDGKVTSTPDTFANGNPIAVVNDMAKRGENTPLISPSFNPSASPERKGWTTSDNAIKGGRDVLDFKQRGGTPVAMKLLKGDAHKEDFPFGKPPPLPANGGLTMAIVFQADAEKLPCRVLRLVGEGNKGEIIVRVLASHQVEVDVGGKKITSSNVDLSRPGLAILTWDGTTSQVDLRTRDHRGVSHRASDKITHPLTPIYNLEIGGTDAAQFGGKLAELVMFAATLRDDQLVLLDKDLREHYFNTPKPDALNPQKNKLLADWSVGEERSIFNGRDLTGWDANSKWWSVKDGAITHAADPKAATASQLYAYWKDGTVGDFELTAKIKIAGGNSGLLYRASVRPPDQNGAKLSGYQADLDPDPKKRDHFGSLYETDGRGDLGNAGDKVSIGDHADVRQKKLQTDAKALGDPAKLLEKLKPGEWNDLRIVANANRLQHYVNGTLVLEAVDEGHGRYKDGVIGLEGTTKGGQVVQFKDIKLKRLR